MKRLRGKLTYELKRHPQGDIPEGKEGDLHWRALQLIGRKLEEGFNCGGVHFTSGGNEYVGVWELK